MQLQLKQWTPAADDQPDAQMNRLVLTNSVDFGGPVLAAIKRHGSGPKNIERSIPHQFQADVASHFALVGVAARFTLPRIAVENSLITQRVI